MTEPSATVGRNQLLATLRECGQRFDVLTTEDGSELLLLGHGGRVLGLFAPGDDENFLWTNPRLASPDFARQLFDSPGWQNTGGERTWVAPEIDIFIPRFPDTSVHVCPPALDPGSHEIHGGARSRNRSPRLVNSFALKLSRSGVVVRLTIDKHWTAVPALAEGHRLETDGLTCAGYTQVATLSAAAATGRYVIGLWSILQVPHGGECIVGTRCPADAKRYLGRTLQRELRTHPLATQYRPSTPGIHKIGFFAPQLTGRIGYLHRTGDRAALIVRQFAVDRSAAYADVPWQTAADVQGPGCAFQVCAVDHPVLGRYVELEHHSPALDGTRPTGVTDVSQLWAYRGPRRGVLAVARRLFEGDAGEA